MEAFVGFVAAALALTGSPEPNTLSLAAFGAAFGRARGLGYMVGLNLGMVLVIAIVGYRSGSCSTRRGDPRMTAFGRCR